MENIWNNHANTTHIIIENNDLQRIVDFFTEFASNYNDMTIPSYMINNTLNDYVVNDDDDTYVYIPKANVLEVMNNILTVKESVIKLKESITSTSPTQSGSNILPQSMPHQPPPANNNTREKMPKSANHTRKRERSRSKK
jgi:PhoPQ-activated pathogenicity-related protein